MTKAVGRLIPVDMWPSNSPVRDLTTPENIGCADEPLPGSKGIDISIGKMLPEEKGGNILNQSG